jgi:hypothetical protein
MNATPFFRQAAVRKRKRSLARLEQIVRNKTLLRQTTFSPSTVGVQCLVGGGPDRRRSSASFRRLASRPTFCFPCIACVIERAVKVDRRLAVLNEQFRPERRAIVKAHQLDAHRILPEPSLDGVIAPLKSPSHVLDGQRGGTPLVEGHRHAEGRGAALDVTPTRRRMSTTVASRCDASPVGTSRRGLA